MRPVPHCPHSRPRWRSSPLRRLPCLVIGLLGAWLQPAPAAAAPFTPASDAEVVERLPTRASDPRSRELLALRQAWRAQPQDLDTALRLAAAYQDEVAATGDPRYMGYAQAALQPWWNLPDPPPPLRVLRAVVLQFDHRFEPALADLQAALAAEPDNARAWAWRTAIQMVRAEYAAARASCEQLARLSEPLVGTACRAQVDAATGHAAAASTALGAALAARGGADASLRLWSLTRLAEIDERRGDFTAAEAAFRQALATGEPDVYMLAAYADFLLDRGRATEVLALLKDRGRADVLLLRLALAARAAGTAPPGSAGPEAAQAGADFAAELVARFDAARRRGDTSHRKEEARFLLTQPGRAADALVLARQNWVEQREAADARVLLEAALAAGEPAAAAPVLRWMADTGFESLALKTLAERLKVPR
jgi:tetratricopeptide (TPR) repeat protein